jgi:hypothetical protein
LYPCIHLKSVHPWPAPCIQLTNTCSLAMQPADTSRFTQCLFFGGTPGSLSTPRTWRSLLGRMTWTFSWHTRLGSASSRSRLRRCAGSWMPPWTRATRACARCLLAHMFVVGFSVLFVCLFVCLFVVVVDFHASSTKQSLSIPRARASNHM